MTKQLLALSFGFAALIAATQIAQAQSGNCAPREQVVDRLAEGYGETRQSVGLAANNAVLEVYASSETGTWTVTVTMPNGMTCLVASGQAYEEVEEQLVPSGLKI
jgi:cation diffusion facilitator CzcD-associated flavoprotein CzcO